MLSKPIPRVLSVVVLFAIVVQANVLTAQIYGEYPAGQPYEFYPQQGFSGGEEFNQWAHQPVQPTEIYAEPIQDQYGYEAPLSQPSYVDPYQGSYSGDPVGSGVAVGQPLYRETPIDGQWPAQPMGQYPAGYEIPIDSYPLNEVVLPPNSEPVATGLWIPGVVVGGEESTADSSATSDVISKLPTVSDVTSDEPKAPVDVASADKDLQSAHAESDSASVNSSAESFRQAQADEELKKVTSELEKAKAELLRAKAVAKVAEQRAAQAEEAAAKSAQALEEKIAAINKRQLLLRTPAASDEELKQMLTDTQARLRKAEAKLDAKDAAYLEASSKKSEAAIETAKVAPEKARGSVELRLAETPEPTPAKKTKSAPTVTKNRRKSPKTKKASIAGRIVKLESAMKKHLDSSDERIRKEFEPKIEAQLEKGQTDEHPEIKKLRDAMQTRLKTSRKKIEGRYERQIQKLRKEQAAQSRS